jgi:hypothetical protein
MLVHKYTTPPPPPPTKKICSKIYLKTIFSSLQKLLEKNLNLKKCSREVPQSLYFNGHFLRDTK